MHTQRTYGINSQNRLKSVSIFGNTFGIGDNFVTFVVATLHL